VTSEEMARREDDVIKVALEKPRGWFKPEVVAVIDKANADLEAIVAFQTALRRAQRGLKARGK
jgi:hypothetical protein